MDLNYQKHLPEVFNDHSKIWIYQCSRIFSISEAFEIEEMLQDFVKSWGSHGARVKGYANLFFGRFIIFMADETATGVSGCSTDSSVRLIKTIEARYKVELFDRLSLAFIVKDEIELIPFSQFRYALDNNFIDQDTSYFNNNVKTKLQLMQEWIIPVKNSWLQKHFVRQV